MSDFLGRLTARHAEGSTPSIVPRAVSRFEAPAMPAEPSVVAPDSSGPEARTPVKVAPPASFERPSSQVNQPVVDRVIRDEKPEITPAERAAPVKARVEQIIKTVETIVREGNVRVEPRTERASERPIVATPVAPRIVPHVEARGAVHGSVVASRSEREAEPAVIRVHIGRIEVRGNPQPTERARPRVAKAAEPPKPMSLERYLSGKERA